MDATYVCWQAPDRVSGWIVYRILPDGSREPLQTFARYLEAARHLQFLRHQAEENVHQHCA